ncbi:GGDEF domain-containing protein [Peptacetobacter sp.]|uniref:GGDEF domain-containing protein n=1 Tax=Peptacetobacter sp. TaxID=2991975 RepID=UPI00261EB650|nr:GGDEF domain-containing protein [Peptacetobacter sp.]
MGLSIIPLIKLLQSFCNSKYTNIIKILIRCTLIISVIVFLFDNTSIFSIEDSDTVIYILLFLAFLIGTTLSFNIYKEKNISIKFTISNLILILGVICGVLSENILIVLISVLLFSFVATISITEYFINSYRNKIITLMREKLVYKDTLTSMKNRHSFEKQIDEDSKNINNYTSYWAISIDINDLKYINNNFGYSHGDRLIKNLADSIEETFDDIGKSFRIGGDEFIILIKNESDEKIERYIELFQSLITSYNKIHDIKLTISIGYDSYKFGYDKSIFDLITRVDYILLKNKKKNKSSWLSDEDLHSFE